MLSRGWRLFGIPHITILTLICYSSTWGRHVTSVDSAGQTFEIPKKAFILRLNKLKAEEDVEEGKESKAIKKKNNQIITPIPSDSPATVSPNGHNLDHKLLQDSSSSRMANISEGTIAVGKPGSSRKGQLRFRIASGNVFSHYEGPSLCSVGVAATEPISINVGNHASVSHTKETPTEGKDESMTNVVSEDSRGSSGSEDPSADPARKKSLVLNIFRRMVEQFEQLQELITDREPEPFNRCQTKMVLENVCCGQGNFTRAKFIRKSSRQGKKKCG